MTDEQFAELIRKKGGVVSKTLAQQIAEAKRGLSAPELLVIRLPLPGQECSPNRRWHFMRKAAAVKKLRSAAHAAAIDIQAFFTRPVIDAVFYHKTRRARDRDNHIAQLKGAIDGLTDAGLWGDDNCVRWGDIEFMIDRTEPRVMLTIHEGPNITRSRA